MENNTSLVKRKESFFQKIKNWFKNLFNKNDNKNEMFDDFEQNNTITHFNNEIHENENLNNLQYEFSKDNVSKIKIQKAENTVDSASTKKEEKISVLYPMSNKELDEMSKNYDAKINDTIKDLFVKDNQIEGCKNELKELHNKSNEEMIRY